MKVTAISPAFYNGTRVRVGDVVDVPEGFKASWAAPTDAVKAPSKSGKPEPRSLSQVGKGESKTFVQVHSEKADLA